ncbi:hypothetical protein EON81_23220 [bacterium]|nr:MAG: hypothetical protein EON81_23220 [bacterium]
MPGTEADFARPNFYGRTDIERKAARFGESTADGISLFGGAGGLGLGTTKAAFGATKAGGGGARGEAVKATVRSMAGPDVRSAKLVRTIGKGESIAALEQEIAQLTYETEGLEHAIISLRDGGRIIVSGGRHGIHFDSRLKRVIIHTHERPTGPSPADFQMLRGTGQRHSYIYELFGGGRTRFGRKD